MEQAASELQFERAARLRDQIHGIKAIHSTQSVTRSATQDIDAVALVSNGGDHCVSIVFIRGGRNLGTTNFFPQGRAGGSRRAAVRISRPVLPGSRSARRDPDQSRPIEDADLLEATLSQQDGARRADSPWCARRARALAGDGAHECAARVCRCVVQPRRRPASSCRASAMSFACQSPPQRIECFDISHTMGERTVASCVVFGPEGALKSDYRRFNIEDIEPGDDYGAMRQALTRRYARIKKGEVPLPDLLLIDGGPGQLAEAVQVLQEFEIDGVTMVGVSKGADRRARPGASVLGASGACHLYCRRIRPPCISYREFAMRRIALRSPVIVYVAPKHAESRFLKPFPDSVLASDAICCGSSAVCRALRAPASTIWRRCMASAANWRSRSMTRCMREVE